MKTIFRQTLRICACAVLLLQAAAQATLVPQTGSLWALGYNGLGELGNSNDTSTSTPVQVVPGNVVSAVAGGGYHSLFIKSDGSLWGMGDNGSGQLGTGVYNSSGTNRPVMIEASNVTAIAAGEFHSLFIKNDGSLWAMGDNGYGELGDGTTDNGNYETNRPEMIVPGGVAAIAAGSDYSMFVETNGSLWAMGYDEYGQLGNGTINANGVFTPVMVVPSGVVAVSAEDATTLFLKSDGSLWGMGADGLGELGEGDTSGYTNRPVLVVASNVVAFASGYDNSLFTKSDGSLWGMGANYEGQLGIGAYSSGTFVPEQILPGGVTQVSVGSAFSLYGDNNGNYWGMGQNAYGVLGNVGSETDLPTEVVTNNVLAISAGYFHSLFIERLTPPPAPVIVGVSLSGANVKIQATNGVASGTYLALMAPTVTLPFSQWTPVATNVLGASLNASGSFTVTVTNGFVLADPQEFFVLQMQ